eukprot:g4331.t1
MKLILKVLGGVITLGLVVALVVYLQDPRFWHRYYLVYTGGGILPQEGWVGSEYRFDGDPLHEYLPLAATGEQTISAEALEDAKSFAAERNSNALLVWHRDQLLVREHFGETTPETLIVGKSMAKMVVSVVIGRAIEDGYIRDLDEPAANYVTEWQGTDKEKITLRHLLHMAAGFEEYYTLDYGPFGKFMRSYLAGHNEDYLIDGYELINEPGAVYDYSQVVSDLLGLILERATGVPYGQYLNESLLIPIGAPGGEGAGNMFAATFGLPLTESVLIGAFIIFVYTVLGGFWAVSVTDAVQGMVMAFATFALPIAALIAIGGVGEFFNALSSMATPEQLSLTGGNLGLMAVGLVIGNLSVSASTLGQPHMLIRFMALKDKAAIRTGRRWAVAWYLVTDIGIVIVGLAGLAMQTQGAPFTATDGGELGKENTKGVSVIFSFQPSERLNAKARIAYSQDDDGPASGTYVQYSGDLGNVPVGTPITVNTTDGLVTTNFGRQYYFGEVPEVPVSNNTRFYDVRVGTPDEVNVGDAFSEIPYDTGTPSLNGFGLRTDMLVSSLAIDYDVSDAWTLSGLFGYSDRDTTQIRDADQYDNPSAAVYTALQLESWSAEGRFTYDDGGPFRFLGGVNYAQADQFGDIDGGYFVWDGLFGGLQVGPGQSSLEVADITTLGIFASVEYDITDWITAALEGRYQKDESETQVGFYGSLEPGSDLSFTEFLPRLSLTASPNDNTNIYLSYAEGTLPGATSDPFAGFTDVERAEAEALFPFIQEDLDSEHLKAYELGSGPEESYSTDQLAESLNGLLAELELDSFHLVGTSIGGILAFTYAADYPDQAASAFWQQVDTEELSHGNH